MLMATNGHATRSLVSGLPSSQEGSHATQICRSNPRLSAIWISLSVEIFPMFPLTMEATQR